MTLPHRLRSVRLRARLTQGQIARWAGVSRCHVSNVEAGRDPAPDALLVVYARRCKLGWLGLAKLRELRAGSPLTPDLVVDFEFEETPGAGQTVA